MDHALAPDTRDALREYLHYRPVAIICSECFSDSEDYDEDTLIQDCASEGWTVGSDGPLCPDCTRNL